MSSVQKQSEPHFTAMTSDTHDECMIMLLCKKNTRGLSCWPVNWWSPAVCRPTEMTFWHWKWCILGVAWLYLMAFVTNIEGSTLLFACWEFPSISIHCWLPLYVRVWEGWPRPSYAARLKARLVLPRSVNPSTLQLHCSALSGQAVWENATFFKTQEPSYVFLQPHVTCSIFLHPYSLIYFFPQNIC